MEGNAADAPDKPFVRKAVAGGWKSALPERCVVQIEPVEIMSTVGYALATSTKPQAWPDPSGAEVVLAGDAPRQPS